MLILSLWADLQSHQIDYFNAAGFTVQDINLVFTGISVKKSNKDYVLHIKNLLDLHQVCSNWFNTLCSSLLSVGFARNVHDPRFFIHRDCLLLVYVRIDIHFNSDGDMELVQPGLLQNVIVACGLQDQSAEHNTPATKI
jgi:hypothetical protein